MPEGIRLTVTIDDGGLGRAMKRAVNLGENLGPVFTASAGLIEGSIDERFETSRGPGGIPWPAGRRPPKGVEKRIVKRGNAKPPHKLLDDTGKLRGSFTHAISAKELQVGVDGSNDSAIKARVHQFGAHIKASPGKSLAFTGPDGGMVFAQSVTIPARPFVGFDDQDIADLDDLWTQALRNAFDGN